MHWQAENSTHDDLHKSTDGKVIRQDCELCHEVI